LVVTNAGNTGSGSFRQAILDANASNGSNAIVFQIPGSGTHTITLTTALPGITYPVFIDGTTQPGFAGSPLIELSGFSAGSGAGLRLLAGSSTIRGLAINGFGAQGILVQDAGSNVIAGNYLGIDLSGTAARGNAQQGIWIDGSPGNVIGGTNAMDRNVISANGDAGIYLLNATGNVVLGNFVGTTAAGTATLGNGNNGVTVSGSSGNTIGRAAPGAGNLVSGNGGSGIYFTGAASTGNTVQNNLIGTDIHGVVSISNAGDGITLQGAGNNLVGGSVALAGNVISGNTLQGIAISDPARAVRIISSLRLPRWPMRKTLPATFERPTPSERL